MIVKPNVNDAPLIRDLIDPFVKKELMLPKSLYSVYSSIRDFWVIRDEEDVKRINGCCALQVSWENLAEIRTLAVRDELQGNGMGRLLVEKCIAEAPDLGIKKIFTLTYVPDFFKAIGFSLIDKNELPSKIWADCIKCQYFPNCRETALIYELPDN